MGRARSKNSIFRVPSTVLRTAYRKQFYPKPMVPMESLYIDSIGVPFASLESDQVLADIGPEGCRKVVT